MSVSTRPRRCGIAPPSRVIVVKQVIPPASNSRRLATFRDAQPRGNTPCSRHTRCRNKAAVTRMKQSFFCVFQRPYATVDRGSRNNFIQSGCTSKTRPLLQDIAFSFLKPHKSFCVRHPRTALGHAATSAFSTNSIRHSCCCKSTAHCNISRTCFFQFYNMLVKCIK